MRIRNYCVLAAMSALLLAAAVPADAATSGDTVVTFTIGAGELSITVPATADLGTGTAGQALSGQLGTVTVTDHRGADPADWTTTVTSTPFTTGSGGAGATVPTTAVDYWSGPATATEGTGTFTPGQPTAGDAVPLSTGPTAFSHTGTGTNSASWDPTLVVNVPFGLVAGTYTGTVTHSVA